MTGFASPLLVAIVGATGTGKSALSLDIAEGYERSGLAAEIVNADAMQLYRGMDIGTAKLPLDERRGIPHHLLDVVDPRDETSVSDFQASARAAINEIVGRGAVPILVGGSGLYVSSVVNNFEFPGTDPQIRARLEAELLVVGPGMLAQRLRQVDPVAALAIGAQNGRRIVRALEVVEITGKPFGSGLPDESKLWMPTVTIGLRAERAELVERLERRVEQMWRDGIVAEAEALEHHGLGVTAARAIGYAQALAQLHGELSEPEAIEQTAILTRKFARRQVNWFKRFADTAWFDYDDPDRASASMALLLKHG